MLPRLLLIALMVATVPTPARAAEHTARTAAFTFLPPQIEITAGDTLALQNLDIDVHTLTSAAVDEEGHPRFDTPFGAPFSQTHPVVGVASMAAGSYDFFCRYHPTLPTMRGTLIVR